MALRYEQESYDIRGAIMQVYKNLGYGFLEAVYCDALSIELTKRSIPFEREKEITINYNGKQLTHTYRADFVCYDKIIIEIKAVTVLNDVHRAQLFNYLRATGFKLGFVVNFGNTSHVEIERRVN